MANDAPLLEQLRLHMPLKSERHYITRAKKSGLVVVDEINGFCTVGMGNMVRERISCNRCSRIREFATFSETRLVLFLHSLSLVLR